MKKLSKVLAVLLALSMVLVLAAGCGQSKDTKGQDTAKSGSTETTTAVKKAPLQIKAAHRWNPNAASFPQDTTLKDYVAKRINEYVGRDVSVEWIIRPDDVTYVQYLQMLVSSNDVPQVLAWDDQIFFGDSFDYGIKSGTYLPITSDMIKQNMPSYTKRLEYYGLDLDKDVLPANVWKDGKNWYIPVMNGSSAISSPNLPKEYGSNQIFNYYSLAFRDDILKKIFPSARSEQEQLALFKSQGKLSVDDITGDIPIHNMDDMINYLRKVKELNLKVGEKTVIPGALCSSSQSVGSVKWSLQTAIGLGWRYPLIWTDPIENSYPISTSKIWKDYLKQWNTMYNDGLLDPEIFVMKDDQYTAKMVNGEYAVFNGWGPVEEARKVGKERGYGYRYLPAFHPMDMNNPNNKYAQATLKASSLFVTNSIKPEDLPDVMKYIDFFMSEESDQLAYWGVPDWYTGEGKDRRYKPEYKDLENWTVYGTPGAKDGTYYGLAGSHEVVMAEGTGVQHDIKPFGFWGPKSWVYPDAPYYVYPKDAQKIAEGINLFAYSDKVMTQDYIVANQVRYREVGWSNGDLMSLPAWNEFDNVKGGNDNRLSELPIKIITDKPEKFEAHYQDYQNALKEDGIEAATKEVQQYLKSVWDTKIVPNIITK